MDARRAETPAHAGSLVHDSRPRRGTRMLSGQQSQHPLRDLVTFMPNHQLLAPELPECHVSAMALVLVAVEEYLRCLK